MDVDIAPLDSDATAEAAAVVSAAARRYEGVIPEDCYDDPYMPPDEFAAETEEMTVFGARRDGRLVGVVGLQEVDDVVLVRHLYVRPENQREGVGTALLDHALERAPDRPVLVGTWRDAWWAVDFYEAHGFENLGTDLALLERYWSIPEEQADASVVLRR